MADTPVTPPPPPQPTPPPPPQPEPEEDLSELSPFKVLQKKGSTSLEVPPPSGAPTPTPSPAPSPTPPPPPPAAPSPAAPVPPPAPLKEESQSLPIPPPSKPTPPPPPAPEPKAAPTPPPPPKPASPPPPPASGPTPPPKAPEPPKPAPAAPVPNMDRDDLLRQAAKAPKESFILPSEDYKKAPPPTEGAIKSMEAEKPPAPPPPRPAEAAPSKTNLGELKPAEPKKEVGKTPPPPMPPRPAPPPPSPAPGQLPPPPKPVPPKPSAAPTGFRPLQAAGSQPSSPLSRPPEQPPTASGMQTLPSAAPSSGGSRIGLISIIGLIVALIIFAGVGYALALNGSRVPIFYTMVSGLKTDGREASLDAAAFVDKNASYTFTSEVTIAPQASSDKPGLPDNTTPAPSVGSGDAVFSLKGVTEGAVYASKGKELITRMAVATNDGTPVPVAQHVFPDGSPSWVVYMPANLEPELAAVTDAELKRTLLYPVIKPIPLETVLTSVATTRAHQKRTSSGKVVTAYSVTFDGKKFASSLPEGAVIKSADGVVELTWKGENQTPNNPVAVKVSATMDYEGQAYKLNQTLIVTAWGAAVDTSKYTELEQVKEREGTEQAIELSTQDFVAQLGIGSLDELPNTLDGTTEEEPGDDTDPSTSPSPSGSAEAPTGESITVLGTTITANPPVPAQPANQAGISRDNQRKQDLALLKSALEKYKKDTGSYPQTSGVEQTISSSALFNALVGKYLTAMPVDPLKQTYWYEYQSDGTTFAVRSVIEDHSDSTAKKGSVYYYFEVTN